MDPQSRKAVLRQSALARRGNVTLQMRIDAARWIEALYPLLSGLAPNGILSGFMPFRGEIDPLPLLARWVRAGQRAAIPRVAAKDSPLVFHRWSPADEYGRGAFGIREPKPTREILTPDIFLVPLAAFDRDLGRIGFGGGFYDRSLEQASAHKDILTIGLAFSVQEVDRVPVEAHDFKLDAILTERGLLGAGL